MDRLTRAKINLVVFCSAVVLIAAVSAIRDEASRNLVPAAVFLLVGALVLWFHKSLGRIQAEVSGWESDRAPEVLGLAYFGFGLMLITAALVGFVLGV